MRFCNHLYLVFLPNNQFYVNSCIFDVCNKWKKSPDLPEDTLMKRRSKSTNVTRYCMYGCFRLLFTFNRFRLVLNSPRQTCTQREIIWAIWPFLDLKPAGCSQQGRKGQKRGRTFFWCTYFGAEIVATVVQSTSVQLYTARICSLSLGNAPGITKK